MPYFFQEHVKIFRICYHHWSIQDSGVVLAGVVILQGAGLVPSQREPVAQVDFELGGMLLKNLLPQPLFQQDGIT